jgi:hypothetical protein
MPVPNLVCEVSYASGFAWSMDGDVPWDTRSYVRKARPNSIALEKGNLGTRMRATLELRASLGRKHLRVMLRDGRFVKLNHFENRLTVRDLKFYCWKLRPSHVYFSANLKIQLSSNGSQGS